MPEEGNSSTGVPQGQPEGRPQAENTGGLDPGLFPGIDKVPQEYRQHIDPILQEVNTNANKKIEELGEKLNTWKPYEELGVHESLDPESMESVLGLLEIINEAEQGNVDGFKEWWQSVGNEYGLMPQEEPEDEFDDEEESLSPEELQQLIDKQVEERMSPIMQQQQDLEQEKMLNSAEQKLDEEINAVKSDPEFGEFDETTEKRICKLALGYDGDEPFKEAAQEYKEMIEDANGKLFAQKTEQPQQPQGPGTPDTTPEAPKSFKDASALARNRLETSVNS